VRQPRRPERKSQAQGVLNEEAHHFRFDIAHRRRHAGARCRNAFADVAYVRGCEYAAASADVHPNAHYSAAWSADHSNGDGPGADSYQHTASDDADADTQAKAKANEDFSAGTDGNDGACKADSDDKAGSCSYSYVRSPGAYQYAEAGWRRHLSPRRWLCL
jgi:hypothetical protein